MATADGLIITAGSVAFLGNMKEAGGFPPNGATTIAATAILTIIAAFTRNSVIEGPFKAFAALVLLAAVYRYVPAFAKDKKNG